MRRLLYLAALSMVIGLVFAPVALAQSRGPSGADGTYNCEDFDTQPQAQAYYDAQGGLSGPNPADLDDDLDGVPCENLPGGGGAVPLPTIPEGEEPVQRMPGEARPGIPESAATNQYVPEEPVSVEPVLPDTGGPALLLPAAGLLLGAGLIGLRLVRRS